MLFDALFNDLFPSRKSRNTNNGKWYALSRKRGFHPSTKSKCYPVHVGCRWEWEMYAESGVCLNFIIYLCRNTSLPISQKRRTWKHFSAHSQHFKFNWDTRFGVLAAVIFVLLPSNYITTYTILWSVHVLQLKNPNKMSNIHAYDNKNREFELIYKMYVWIIHRHVCHHIYHPSFACVSNNFVCAIIKKKRYIQWFNSKENGKCFYG